jgi:hypothetical protein
MAPVLATQNFKEHCATSAHPIIIQPGPAMSSAHVHPHALAAVLAMAVGCVNAMQALKVTIAKSVHQITIH